MTWGKAENVRGCRERGILQPHWFAVLRCRRQIDREGKAPTPALTSFPLCQYFLQPPLKLAQQISPQPADPVSETQRHSALPTLLPSFWGDGYFLFPCVRVFFFPGVYFGASFLKPPFGAHSRVCITIRVLQVMSNEEFGWLNETNLSQEEQQHRGQSLLICSLI